MQPRDDQTSSDDQSTHARGSPRSMPAPHKSDRTQSRTSSASHSCRGQDFFGSEFAKTAPRAQVCFTIAFGRLRLLTRVQPPPSGTSPPPSYTATVDDTASKASEPTQLRKPRVHSEPNSTSRSSSTTQPSVPSRATLRQPSVANDRCVRTKSRLRKFFSFGTDNTIETQPASTSEVLLTEGARGAVEQEDARCAVRTETDASCALISKPQLIGRDAAHDSVNTGKLTSRVLKRTYHACFIRLVVNVA